MCSRRRVPGIAQVTAGWLSTNLSSTCAQLGAADLGGPRRQRLGEQAAQQAAAAERHVDDDGDAALGGERQDAPLGLAVVERVVDLQEVEPLGAQHRLDLGVGRRRVVGDAEVADPAGVLPARARSRGGCASRPGCGSASGRCGRCAAGAATLPSGARLRRGRCVQTLVARKASPRRPLAASSSPVVASARPYIGELSSTLPPASSSAATTPGSSAYSGVPGAWSKPT